MTALEKEINKQLLDPEEFEDGSIEQKMDQIVDAIQTLNLRFSQVHNIVNDVQDGLDPRLEGASAQTTDNQERIEELEQENKKLRFELDLLKNLFFKQHAVTESLREKATLATAKSMSSNVCIVGIDGDKEKDERCTENVNNFIEKVLEIVIPKAKNLRHLSSRGVQTQPQ